MKKYILTLDQGTTSSKAILFDKQQHIVKEAQMEITQIYPTPGWVEQDPLDIWASTYAVMNEVIAKAGISPNEIDSIAITNQRETTIVWDKKTGEPVYNAIVWQCRRTADYCHSIHETDGISIQEKTGLLVDPYFSASKIVWILENVEGCREKAETGSLYFGTVDTWLLYKLTQNYAHLTDHTNASRTMLYNIHTLEWDQELLDLFNIPISMLPEVKESSSLFGYTNIQGYTIPITSLVGDQQASLFGQKCFNKGDAKSTYGTGCFILMNTKDTCVTSTQGLISTIGISYNEEIEYALEGSVFMGGAIVQWLRDELKIISTSKEIEKLVATTIDNQGVYFVPAFTGLGAPYWLPEVRGSIFGLTRGTNDAIIARAGLEAIAFQVKDVVEAMSKEANLRIKSLRVDGGTSTNSFLLQFQADILNCKISTSSHKETTALGAYYLAGLYTGYFKSIEELTQTTHTTYNPTLNEHDRNSLIQGWNRAISASQYFYQK